MSEKSTGCSYPIFSLFLSAAQTLVGWAWNPIFLFSLQVFCQSPPLEVRHRLFHLSFLLFALDDDWPLIIFLKELQISIEEEVMQFVYFVDKLIVVL